MPVSMNSSVTSFRRTLFPLMRYSLSPLRYSFRVTLTTAPCSSPSSPVSLLISSVTAANPIAFRVFVPEKMTSSILLPRSVLVDCSPSTQRTASPILLLPLPLGPTTAVRPLSNVSLILSGKDLKPCNSRDCRYIALSHLFLEHFGSTASSAADSAASLMRYCLYFGDCSTRTA